MDAEKGWSATLQPLADDIVAKYKGFLPSLVYPVRVGEHTNTAFGLIFAYDYAKCKHIPAPAPLTLTLVYATGTDQEAEYPPSVVHVRTSSYQKQLMDFLWKK